MRLEFLLHDKRGQAFFESFRSREDAGPLRLCRAPRAAGCVSSEAQKLKPSDFLRSTAPFEISSRGGFLCGHEESGRVLFSPADLMGGPTLNRIIRRFLPHPQGCRIYPCITFLGQSMTATQAIFHRTPTANALTQKLLHPSGFDVTARDGVFLIGSRGIGKTTFLREDLMAELERQGAVVIYADLGKTAARRSPVKSLLNAIQETLQGVQPPSIPLSFDVTLVGTEAGVSIAEAFVELIQRCNRSAVVIIDEVQALQSRTGQRLLRALKAARDAVNLRPDNDSDTYLLIVAAGSCRRAVTSMTSDSSQAFYGAERLEFPLLGHDYIDWQVRELLRLPSTDRNRIPSRKALEEGFKTLGCRPKFFLKVLNLLQKRPGRKIDQTFLSTCTSHARNEAEAH